jgi:uncharacterized membrane protein YkvA (DUF1232 family)
MLRAVSVVEIVVGAVVALVLTWLAFLVFLAVVRPRGIGVSEARSLVPDVARLVKDLAKDKTAPKGVRRRLVIAGLYVASPIQLIPNFIPVLGYADDVTVVLWGLRSAVRKAGPDALERHWRGDAEGLAIVRDLTGMRVASGGAPSRNAA